MKTVTKKHNRGGARIGAGRKPGPKGTRTPLTVKLPPLVQQFLDYLRNLSEHDATKPSRGEFISSQVEASKEFRQWRKEFGK